MSRRGTAQRGTVRGTFIYFGVLIGVALGINEVAKLSLTPLFGKIGTTIIAGVVCFIAGLIAADVRRVLAECRTQGEEKVL